MTYGRNLERRDFGVYYFRQTLIVEGKQVVKRFSLKTKNTTVAKFLALQLKARIEMIDPKNIRTFELAYDDNNNIKSVSVKDEQDSKNLQQFLQLTERNKAEEHKRAIERMKLEAELRASNQFADSERGQDLIRLREKLENDLKPQRAAPAPIGIPEPDINLANGIEALGKSYLESVSVGSGTRYKYKKSLEKFVTYATMHNIYTIDKVDRKFTYAYLIYLRTAEKKNDTTIKNIFNSLSSFHNHLLRTGDAVNVNPFVGHKLNVETTPRMPFTIPELQQLFYSAEIKSNEKLFWVCMLLVTTGARPNEICQLWTDDIQQEERLWTIRITENPERDQSLKTKTSKRKIYLNSLLIELGFLDYLNSKQLGQIFELKKPALKSYSTFISEELSIILRKLGIKEKTMYCFRHTVVNRLKQNLILQTINEDLVGHEGKGTNATVYSQKHSAQNLKNATEEILRYTEVFTPNYKVKTSY
jgi:integrase